MSFHCVVVTPEQQAFDAGVKQAILPAHDGQVGVLTNRAPMLVQLGVGVLRLDLPDNSTTFMVVDGGVAQMWDNRLTIVTERAFAPKDVQPQAALAEFAAAEARPVSDPAAAAQRKHDLALARAKQELAERR